MEVKHEVSMAGQERLSQRWCVELRMNDHVGPEWEEGWCGVVWKDMVVRLETMELRCSNKTALKDDGVDGKEGRR